MKRRAPKSKLSRRARTILARTAAARRALDARIAGVVVDGGPPELGPVRKDVISAFLDRDIVKHWAVRP